MDMQNVSNLQIPEGAVRTIHDKDSRLIWGRLAYDTKYAGDTSQDGTPTPDAPIAVQVVTGEQTVTIDDDVDSENFTISLGTIELCKIGNYQDYIYKSGDDWYVHKACKRHTFDGSENWVYIGGTPPFYYECIPHIGQQTTNGKLVFSNYFLPTSTWSERKVGIWLDRNLIVKTEDSLAGTGSVDTFKTWLSTHNMIVYYALATATDTKITDNTLIGQLNIVHQFLTRYGYSTTVSGNLPLIIDKTNL